MTTNKLTMLTGLAGCELTSSRKHLETRAEFPSLVRGITSPVAQLNRNIYRKNGLSWSSAEYLASNELWFKEFVEKAAKTLSLLAKEEPLGICDPLLIRAVPIWAKAAKLLGMTEIDLVVVHEPPSELAERLHRRHGLSFHAGHQLYINQLCNTCYLVHEARSGKLPISNSFLTTEGSGEFHILSSATSVYNMSALLYANTSSVV